MDELIQQISDAVARGDWLTVAPLAVVVIGSLVSAGLKLAGKPVPILDQVVAGAKALGKVLPKKAAPQPAPDEKQGVEAVVEVKQADEEKKP